MEAFFYGARKPRRYSSRIIQLNFKMNRRSSVCGVVIALCQGRSPRSIILTGILTSVWKVGGKKVSLDLMKIFFLCSPQNCVRNVLKYF